MNATKVQEAIADLRGEAKKLLQLADDLEATLKRSGIGMPGPLIPPRSPASPPLRGEPQEGSYLTLAVAVLRQQHSPIHITDLVKEVEKKRGEPTTRSSVESALVRGMKSARYKHVIKRTGPGMFAVSEP
jgi:hypothetical protein